jgi:hypothetical protein
MEIDPERCSIVEDVAMDISSTNNDIFDSRSTQDIPALHNHQMDRHSEYPTNQTSSSWGSDDNNKVPPQ